MRGKILLLISLLALVFAAMPTIGVASSTPMVWVEPSIAEVVDFDPTAPPTVTVDIMIKDVSDLYAWGLRVRWDFDLLWLNLADVVEGPLLQSQPMGSAFAKVLNFVDRFLDMGCTTIGAYPGVTVGSEGAVLATISWSVRELGACDIEVFDVLLLDSGLDEITTDVTSGSFSSTASQAFAANLVSKRIMTHHINVYIHGEKQYFYAKIKNVEGPYPLYVKAEFDLVHEGGDAWTLKTGVAYTQPNDIVELSTDFVLGPLADWYPWPYWGGKFYCTCTAYYSYGGVTWYEAPKFKVFSFSVEPTSW